MEASVLGTLLSPHFSPFLFYLSPQPSLCPVGFPFAFSIPQSSRAKPEEATGQMGVVPSPWLLPERGRGTSSPHFSWSKAGCPGTPHKLCQVSWH